MSGPGSPPGLSRKCCVTARSRLGEDAEGGGGGGGRTTPSPFGAAAPRPSAAAIEPPHGHAAAARGSPDPRVPGQLRAAGGGGAGRWRGLCRPSRGSGAPRSLPPAARRGGGLNERQDEPRAPCHSVREAAATRLGKALPSPPPFFFFSFSHIYIFSFSFPKGHSIAAHTDTRTSSPLILCLEGAVRALCLGKGLAGNCHVQF